MVAEAGFEPHDLRVMSPTSYQTAPLRDVNFLVLYYYSTEKSFIQALFTNRFKLPIFQTAGRHKAAEALYLIIINSSHKSMLKIGSFKVYGKCHMGIITFYQKKFLGNELIFNVVLYDIK